MKKQDVAAKYINNKISMRDYAEIMIAQGTKVMSYLKIPKSCKKINNLGIK